MAPGCGAMVNRHVEGDAMPRGAAAITQTAEFDQNSTGDSEEFSPQERNRSPHRTLRLPHGPGACTAASCCASDAFDDRDFMLELTHDRFRPLAHVERRLGDTSSLANSAP